MLLHSRVQIFVISRAAGLNVLPLSDTTNEGLPRLAVNLLKLLRNVLAVRSGARSKWMALVTQHALMQIQTFRSGLLRKGSLHRGVLQGQLRHR